MDNLTAGDKHTLEHWAILPAQKLIPLRIVAFMLDRDINTIYNHISRGVFGIPVVKTGQRSSGCMKRDVEDYLESRRVDPAPPSEAAA